MTLLRSSPNGIAKNFKALSLHDISALLSPVITNYLYIFSFCQKSVALTVYICSHTYLISLFLLRIVYFMSRSILIQCFFLLQIVLAAGTKMSTKFPTKSWPKHKRTIFFETLGVRRLRKKMAFELVTFMLGAGNGIFLLILWPGWLFLAGVVYMIRMACG